MKYLHADFIFNGREFLPQGSVLVLKNDGSILDILPKAPNEEVLHLDGLLMPGFVNAHCHLELSYLKNKISSGNGLISFLIQINQLYQEKISTTTIQEAIEQAEKEMLQNGIVLIGDICNTDNTFDIKVKSPLHYHSFVEVYGLADEKINEKIQAAINLKKLFSQHHTSSVVFHAPYSISEKLRKEYIFQEEKLSSIHMQESKEENTLFRYGQSAFDDFFSLLPFKTDIDFQKNKSSFSFFHSYLHAIKKVLLVHNTYVEKEDLVLSNQFPDKYVYCLCPKANLFIENCLPPIPDIMQNQNVICIGTDSLASNDTLSIYEELKTIHEHFSQIPVQTLLQWGTLNGAIALQKENEFGEIAIGKKPGIIHIPEFINTQKLPVCRKILKIY
ncbi:MAG: amidohydrolase family protein [Chitinophagaceae bacterium]